MKNPLKKFLAAAVFLLTSLLMNAAEPTTGDEPKPAIELAVPFTDNAILLLNPFTSCPSSPTR